LEITAFKIRLKEALYASIEALSTDGLEVILIGPTALLALAATRDNAEFHTLAISQLDFALGPQRFDQVASTLARLGWTVTTSGTGPGAEIALCLGDLRINLCQTMLRTTLAADRAEADELERSLHARLIPTREFGTTARVLPTTDLLFSIIVEGLANGPADTSWILNSSRLLRESRDDLDWSHLAVLIARTNCGSAVGAALQLLDELCEDVVPPEFREQLAMVPASDQERTSFTELARPV
jgi:hypothetical protein